MKQKFDINAVRNKLKAQNEKKSGGDNKGRTFGDYYPFWNIEEGQKAIVRVLPYKGMEDDSVDPFVEKLEHVLSINGEDKKIPCIKMYGEDCPICALSAKYYKANDKVKGKYYWRDKKSLGSVYVVKDPLPADEATGTNDQGKQKVVQFGNQLAKKYDKAFMTLAEDEDDPLEAYPWDLTAGRNFSIIKEMKGEFPNYDSSSTFASKSTSLPDEFLANFEPADLHKYLPPNPGLDKVQRYLDAHLTGEDFVDDEETPAKGKLDSKAESKKTETKKPAAAKVEVDEGDEDETPKVEAKKPAPAKKPVVVESEESEGDEDGDDDQDFLEKLKRRKTS